MATNLPQVNQTVPAVFSSDPAAVAAAETAKARIQMAYFLAVQKPRDPDHSRVKILQACERPEFAERVEFRKPQGNKKNEKTGQWEKNFITGPSVRFAEEAIRQWGNTLVETQVIYEDDHIRRSRVTALDLESNSTYTKEIQVTKTVERRSKKDREDDVLRERVNSDGKIVYVLRSTEDELHQKEAALISKAVRNEGLRLIPADIVDEAIATARETLHNRDAKDPREAAKKVTRAFGDIGVYPKDLAAYMGQSLDTLAPHQIQQLRGIYQSIRDGEVSWPEVVAAATAGPAAPTEDRVAELQQKAADLKKNRAEPVRERVEPSTEAAGEGDFPPPSDPAAPSNPNEPDDFDLMEPAALDAWLAKKIVTGGTGKAEYLTLRKIGDQVGLRALARKLATNTTEQGEDHE